ncbi:hypothetical protein NLD30_09770 [SCandidatus Aminicenantes bacterium Aminicenantia_JdfR_composite]|nr:hypothetical protein [SCandidatus Aminicenantes bacterium Aminicenantia_JdfR_composite]
MFDILKRENSMETRLLKEKISKIYRQSTSLFKLFSKYQNLEKEQEKNCFLLEDIILDIEKILKDFPLSDKSDFENWIKEQKVKVEKLKEDFKFDFGNQLERELSSKGFDIEWKYPYIYAGLYKIQLDFGKKSANIYWGPEFVKKVRLLPSEIAKEIENFEKKLKNRPFETDSYLNLLEKAYKRVLENHNYLPGEKAPIIEVLIELTFLLQDKKFRENPTKSNFKEYNRIFFAYDLYRIKNSQEAKARGLTLYIATFDSTKFKGKVLFVPDNEKEGTRYAYLAFEKA